MIKPDRAVRGSYHVLRELADVASMARTQSFQFRPRPLRSRFIKETLGPNSLRLHLYNDERDVNLSRAAFRCEQFAFVRSQLIARPYWLCVFEHTRLPPNFC